MSLCCETPSIKRIEKIKKNQIISPGSAPYYENPWMIPESPMNTMPPFLDQANPLIQNDYDEMLTYDEPPTYGEMLTYDDLQYMNQFYKTQIGHYVNVEQLIGSNTLSAKTGYLIAVGTNYIVLQDENTGDMTILDFDGIKSMYVYNNYNSNPFLPLDDENNIGSCFDLNV